MQLEQAGTVFSGKILHLGDPSADDLALLEADHDEEVWACFGTGAHLGDRFYTFGFTQDHSGAESVTLSFEGTATRGGVELLKFKEGQLETGMSGAPVLNLRTGLVSGVLVISRNRRMDLGGLAVQARTVLETIPQLEQTGRIHFASARAWKRLASPFRGIDLSTEAYHEWLFPQDPIDVEDAFVEPAYRLIEYREFDRFEPSPRDFVADAISILKCEELLFIFGPYGSGKTLLTKILQRHLWDQGYEVHFFRCSDLYQRIKVLERFSAKQEPEDPPMVIALDGYDETNLLRRDRKGVKREFLQRIVEISKNPGVFLILNSRLIPLDEESIYLGISGLLYDELRAEVTTFIELDAFRTQQIEQWLNASANEHAKRGSEERLFRSDLRHLHKHLAAACKNPLFLYMLSTRFYESGFSGIEDIYELYRSFVDKTVTGKFRGERSKARSIAEISRSYRRFLRGMALEISAANDFVFDASNLNAWNLDPNLEIYSISYERVQDTVDRTAREILAPKALEDLLEERLTWNVLTCYFLEESAGRWRFSDNNILFFLNAEVFLEALAGAAGTDSDQDPLATFPQALRRSVPLHPLSIELLMSRLVSMPPRQQQSIRDFLKALVEDQRLLKLWRATEPALSASYRRIETVMALAFLKLYQGSHQLIPRFLPELGKHARELAYLDEVAFNIFRAFFRGITVKHGFFELQNFSGFNFQRSRFVATQFDICDFIDPAADGLKLEACCFRLCKLEPVRAREISGSARFVQCTVDLEIRDPGSLELEFDHCHIKNLHLYANRRSSENKVQIAFASCKIDHLILRKLDISSLEIADSIYPQLKLEGSRARVNIQDSERTSRKVLGTDGQSQVTLNGERVG